MTIHISQGEKKKKRKREEEGIILLQSSASMQLKPSITSEFEGFRAETQQN